MSEIPEWQDRLWRKFPKLHDWLWWKLWKWEFGAVGRKARKQRRRAS